MWKRLRRKLTLSSKANPAISELAIAFSPKEISPDLLDGLSILPSKDKREFFSLESKFPQSSPNSKEVLTRTKPMFFSDSSRNTHLKTENKEKAVLLKRQKPKLKVFRSLMLEKNVEKSRPYHLKFGLNHVTKLIEERKAKLVVIASNVDPIELVVWLPALCRKMDIPYCFVRGKARLGQLVHQKNAAVVALTEVRKEDEVDLSNIVTSCRANFNDNVQMRKEIGGFKKGSKSQVKYDRVVAEREREAIQKLQWAVLILFKHSFKL